MHGSGAMRLKDKVALVTGAGRGLGHAIAGQFAREGAHVFCCDVDESAAWACSEQILAEGGSAAAIAVDVADRAAIAAMAAQALAAQGRVDVVCNNAGVLDDFRPAADTDDALWDRVLAINLTAPFLISRAFIPSMLENGGGTFVNLASMAGLVAQAGGTAYTVSKHGVIGLTRQISADYGQRGIRANAICPGSIDTAMSREFLKDAPEVQAIVDSVPAGRMGRPEEIAELATYLASDASGFIHGAAMVIDGGWTIR